MIFLAYKAKGLNVKDVSKILGQKHKSVNGEFGGKITNHIYKNKWDVKEVIGYGRNAENVYYPGRTRTIELLDVEVDDLETWLFTLTLENPSFIPLGYFIFNITEERFKQYKKEYNKVSDTADEYCKNNMFTICAGGKKRLFDTYGYFNIPQYELVNKLKKAFQEVAYKGYKEVQEKYEDDFKFEAHKINHDKED